MYSDSDIEADVEEEFISETSVVNTVIKQAKTELMSIINHQENL
jgi:hypothetical protein